MTPEPYASSAVFDELSLPDALRNEHRTKQGTWGLLRVFTGQVRLIFTDPHRELLVTPETPAPIAPLATHYVVPLGKMSMQVEFHRSPPIPEAGSTDAPQGTRPAPQIHEEEDTP